jgi:flagellar hook-associated protein 1
VIVTSTFHLLETSKRSLFAQQAAMQVTGHNISNSNTPGFSRQIANLNTTQPMEAVGLSHSTAAGQIGTGVEVGSVTRIREQFLDDQFRNENKSLGSWSIKSDTLGKLEAIVSEPSNTGIRTVLSNFWSSWSDLSKDPENVTGRKIVRENAAALADAFNYTSKQLSDLSSDLTKNIGVKASDINSTTSTIAKLNSEIQRIEGLGDNANDLRDQRDLLVDNLSKVVNIQVQDTPQGYTINMGSINLVNSTNQTQVTAASLTAAFASGDLNSGEVQGMISSRDVTVADYQKQLDNLANSIANGDVTVTIPKGSVLPEGTVLNGVTYSGSSRTLTSDVTATVKGLNGLHKLGYNLNTPVQSGGDFFTSKDGSSTITAQSFQLNPDLSANPEKIATSLRTTGTTSADTVIKGNNTLAVLVSQLKDNKFSFSTSGSLIANGTLDDYYASIVGQLGIQSKEATRQLTNQQSIVDQVDTRKQSVSGVSLDEEMSNMVKFQKSYAASARMMTTFDEMIDKVINSMGTVGR